RIQTLIAAAFARTLASALLIAGSIVTVGVAADPALPRDRAVPGGVVMVRVPALSETTLNAPPDVTRSPRAYFGDAPVMLLPRAANSWLAVVGLPLSQPTGPAQIRVEGLPQGSVTFKFTVLPAHYRTQRLRVPPAQVDLSAADLARVSAEHD